MTKEELAAKLTGREIGQEITEAEEKLAKNAGLVVIFGASDDLCELRGAINDEADVCAGGTVWISHQGGLLSEIEHDDVRVLKKYSVLGAALATREKAAKIYTLWCDEPEYSWTFATDVPHATFEVMEDGEHYCRGIVIDLKDLSFQPQP